MSKPAAPTREQQELADHFRYLDLLRESGVTNMYGARPYLMRDHGLGADAAARVLGLWMGTFDREKSPVERAQSALTDNPRS